ncbi:MAG: SGNH/GDSL hydrolase family protein [Verrucomicrobiota bacterium]
MPFRLAVAILLSIVAFSGAQVPAKIAIIGDSLSREYQFEFPEFPEARNWVEILAARRSSDVDFGDLEELGPVLEFLISQLPLDPAIKDAIEDSDGLEYFECNKAVPGFESEDYREYLTNVFLNPVNAAFRGWVHPALDDADVVVIFIGGNDIDRVYHDNQSSVDDKVDDIEGNINWLKDHVLDRNSDARIVIANVPHVGATPQLKNDPNTINCPECTPRITAALNDLNGRLQTLADSDPDFALADIYKLTLDTLDTSFYCIGGVSFINDSTDLTSNTSEHPNYVWLGGSISQNFHPNTQGQAVVANAILTAINTFPEFDIPLLTNREIVEDVVGLEFDMAFNDWAAGFGLSNLSHGDDREPDGIKAILEMAMDLDPTTFDKMPSPEIIGDDFTLTYPVRDQDCEYVILWPQYSTDGKTWNFADPSNVINNNDGTYTFSMPVSGNSILLTRLFASEN